MNLEESIEQLDNEFKSMIRKELKWLYERFNRSEKKEFETKVLKVNNTFIKALTEIMAKKHVQDELQTIGEFIEMFKLSRN